MSKTIKDLSDAVKRHLTSNTTLVNIVQGQAQNSEDLVTQIDAAIMEAANNARRYAERLHDFAANDMTGRAVLTHACPLNINRVPVKQFYGDVDSVAFADITRIDSSPDDWPELVLPRDVNELPQEVENITSIKFVGADVAPLTANYDYSVISTKINNDNSVSIKLGFSPGTEIDIDTFTITASTAEIKRFKTISQVYLYDQSTRSIKPIPTIKRRTQVLRNIKLQGLSGQQLWPPSEVSVDTPDTQAIIANGEIHIEPASAYRHIAVDGNVWMDEYTSETDTDFLLQNGFDFMMWQTIIEVNHMLLKFVARQEGTVSPPTQARDAAWESLVIWDSTQVDGNIFHDL